MGEKNCKFGPKYLGVVGTVHMGIGSQFNS